MGNKVNTNFPITVYGKVERFTDTISKGRCRIFYKGGNRNGTYITDEFAEKLIASAPYAPIKGIYDTGDYTDHGKARTEGRIYGVVPANPNFAWEKHEDADGVIREYACCDVLYYTALYKEAGEIDTKGQSMELYRQTLKGAWQFVNGKKYFVFTEGSFLGLQVLGDDVEPCFEGAGFYTKVDGEQMNEEDGIIAILSKYEQKADIFQYHEQGGNIMPEINFKISDGQKYEYLWTLLNPNYNEQGNWTMEFAICDVYEEYAVVRNLPENIFERVYYTKNDETDSLEITKKERCYIVDITEEEKTALEGLHNAAGATFSAISESFTTMTETIATLNTDVESLNTTITEHLTSIEGLNNRIGEYDCQISELNNQISEFNTKIAEHEATISTLTTERDELSVSLNTANSTIEEVNVQLATANENLATMTVARDTAIAERDTLAAFKQTVINEQKKAIIDSYANQLPTEITDGYINNLDNYALEQLDMLLTYEVKKLNPTLFSANPVVTPVYVPKDDGGAARTLNDILAKYEK